MAADPILLTAGKWLGAASGVLALTTIAGYMSRWGIRFRLVGVTSFTALLAVSCLTFAVSYSPRVQQLQTASRTGPRQRPFNK
jgi:hypothetical protein